MQITPTALAPTPATPTPGGTAPAEPGAFAKMLSAQQPVANAPGKPQRARADAATPKPKADGPAEAPAPDTLPPRAAIDATAPVDADADAELLAESVTVLDSDSESASAAAEMLVVLNLPPATTPTPLPAAPPQAALPALPALPVTTDVEALATGSQASTAAPLQVMPHPSAPGRVRADTAQADTAQREVSTSAGFADAAQRAAEQTPLLHAEAAMQRTETRIELPRSFELPQPFAPIGPAQRPDAAFSTPQVALAMPTPATAPEFREALGVQVSVLARDGVQHAELHLNPSEMGPISVQIALAGTQAQVDFGAESLLTRQIIEAGLPELASALRDAGFTLAGGGVSQHPRGRSDGQPGDGTGAGSQRSGNGSDSAEPVVQRISTRLPLGAVDLYA